MGKRLLKITAMVMAGGMMFHSLGCLNLGGMGKWAGPILYDGALNALWEFVLDNDAVFDLFQDDFGTGALYDDRFVADPTRAEPDDDAQAAADDVAGR